MAYTNCYPSGRPYRYTRGRYWDSRDLDIGNGFSHSYSPYLSRPNNMDTQCNRRYYSYEKKHYNGPKNNTRYVEPKKSSNRYISLPRSVVLSSNSLPNTKSNVPKPKKINNNKNKNNKKPNTTSKKTPNKQSKKNPPKNDFDKSNYYITIHGKVQNLPPHEMQSTFLKVGKPDNPRLTLNKLSDEKFVYFKKLRKDFMNVLYACSQVNRFQRGGLRLRFSRFEDKGPIPRLQTMADQMATIIYNSLVVERNERFKNFYYEFVKMLLPKEYLLLVLIMGIKFYRGRHGHAIRPWKTYQSLDEFLITMLKWTNTSPGYYLKTVVLPGVTDPDAVEDVSASNLNMFSRLASSFDTTDQPIPMKIPRKADGSKKK